MKIFSIGFTRKPAEIFSLGCKRTASSRWCDYLHLAAEYLPWKWANVTAEHIL
jgi:hypothetical protein